MSAAPLPPSSPVRMVSVPPLPPSSSSSSRWFNASCGATTFMAVYMAFAAYNIYHLMFPLRLLDLGQFPKDTRKGFVHPLWPSSAGLHLHVYLSTEEHFSLQFLSASTRYNSNSTIATTAPSPSKHVLLWEQSLNRPSMSGTFLLTNVVHEEDNTTTSSGSGTVATATAQTDASFQFAEDWLNRTENAFRDVHESGHGGILSTLSAASGQGIESTSVLLTMYEAVASKIRATLQYLSIVSAKTTTTNGATDKANGFVGRSIVPISSTSPIWSALRSNATVYIHVLVIRTEEYDDGVDGSLNVPQWPAESLSAAERALRVAARKNALLTGHVKMIKYELPNHIGKPRRALYRDLQFYWNKYVLGSREMPPWEMAIFKPREFAEYQSILSMKKNGMGYAYWKPEVSIKYVSDADSYPAEYAHLSGMPVVQLHHDKNDRDRNQQRLNHPTGYAFTPALHVDEMGMTSEKYIPVNDTITSLPLRISFDRSDMDYLLLNGNTNIHQSPRATATTGGISPARWRLLNHLSGAIEKQKGMGFDDADIDDIKRLIADTNITLLSITMLASALHLLFEFLTFKSEVSFWKKNKDLTGLSVRSLFLDFIGQTIILCYLIERESSLLTTIPSGIGCMIALWKGQRASGLQFVKIGTNRNDRPSSWWNRLSRDVTGYELRATRLEAWSSLNDTDESQSITAKSKDRLIAMTIEADRLATRYLGAVLLPLAGGYTLYSLIYDEHRGWYSWLVSSAASAVYALGFVLMTPQLFLNWKMKSVAHLPWRVLVYKSLNTFIDDLFSFIIRMPTMARISCFRDDVVFFIYLYQRWLYPVDASRPAEGGGEGEQLLANEASNANETKKIQ